MFTLDTKNTATLTSDTRSASGSFTNDSSVGFQITWGRDRRTWAQETHTWAQMVSSLSLDARN